MNTIRYTLFIFLQISGLSVFSQKQNIRFEHLGPDQGLSQSNVICILQDSRGFMWFGTRDGLNKYDGYKFTVYKNDVRDPHSLGNNYIRSIVETRDGNIWVATSGGLCLFDRFRNRFTNFKHDPKNRFSISNDFVLNVMEDYLGNIWAGTENGLNVLDKKTSQFTRYTHTKGDTASLADVQVKKIFEDSHHTLWICTNGGGLNRFNRENETFTRFQHNEKDNNSISSNNINTMFEDSKHRLWVGTNDNGLDLLNKQTGQFSHFKHDDNDNNSLAANSVFAINEDNENKLWVGTENGGLSIFNPETGKFHTYQNDVVDNTSLSNNSIYAICKDKKSNIWLGTFTGGVDMVNPDTRKFAQYKHILNKNSLSNNNVLCIYEDSQKNIWIGTDGGGLNLFNPKTGHFTHFRHEKNNKNSIAGNYVLSVCEDSKGNIWVGTWADGVTVFNKTTRTFKHFKNDPHDPSSLSNNNAWKIFEDKEKNIWIGTYGGGLNLFDPATNSFTSYQYKENNKTGLSNNNIYSIFEDNEKKLWISTDGGGLNLFDRSTKTFLHFLHDEKKNSISNNSTGTICEDRNKNLWIGTMAGLSFLDKKTNKFTNYTTADGLPNNVIFGILEDTRGNIWISTNKGISRFDPVNKAFKNFGVSDGLQSNEFKIQAYCKSNSGTMYFGGNNGFNQFLPDSIEPNSFPPPLVITSFQIFNKEVPVSVDSTISPLKKDITETKEITLSYKSSVISFEFASLNYTIPEKKQYAYMLEGFDETWNEVGTQRTATYTNLDAGEYVFKIKGLNNDGSWSEAITSIRLTITPPFWLTWWFKILCISFVIGCFAAFYKMRVKTITKQKAVLEKQVEERTNEIVKQKEEMHAVMLDKAVAQGKFEIASDVMHDIGNAVVGFGSYLTRIRRLQNEESPDNLRNLAGFFEKQKPVLTASLGEAKANAVVKILTSMGQTQKTNQEEINKSITEQLNIITNIQEILNIQRQYITGHESQERKPVNIRNIVNDSLSMLFDSLDKTGIAVSLDIASELPIIKGDRTKLMQALLTIFKNSIEAMDPGAPKKNISVTISVNDGELVILIQDSGKGFDKTVEDRLFNKGFTTKATGTGMGLYSCRAILESHEGNIAVTSEGEGKGTVTRIGFRLSSNQAAA